MTQLESSSPPVSEQQARLRRSLDDKVIAGVCGGLGQYFNTDPLWFRLGFVVVTLAGGAGLLFYLIAWLVIPQAQPGESVTSRKEADSWYGALLAGVVLVTIGLLLLAQNFLPWFEDLMWPLAVVAAGVGLIYLGGRK